MWADKWAEQWRFLEHYDIRTVVDIGANTGQFSEMIHRACPSARLYAFEPVRDCFEELERKLSDIPRAEAIHLAVDDRNGECTINRSEYTVCSSMLRPTDRLVRACPKAGEMTPERVEMATLDDAMRGRVVDPQLLVKIDVQGYEPQVIQRGRATLAAAMIVAIECTFVEEYEGQPLFDDIYTMMKGLGFTYVGSAGQYKHDGDSRFAYADGIFENASLRKPE